VGLEFFLVAVGILMGLAILDLMVGVSNDAVNFLNSSIGSRVAPRRVIMIIASLGIMAGVIFSSGMMEVARRGIFHPQLFTMPELMTIFLAVMLTDVILLDLFNTFGFPTSTTVSIVFELLGAAVIVTVLKVLGNGGDLAEVQRYINSGRAMVIISGILASVAVAFICGALVQFISRTIFTFDYRSRMRRYGALWGGIAMASITYFILVKGAKGATFASPEMLEWIRTNTWLILLASTAASAVLFQLLLVRHVNILKPIVLVGTFALALAFAANDLVNFIGVPLAGLHSYQAAIAASDPLGATMEALAGKVRSETFVLLPAGLIMVVTLWSSRKARTVTETEVNLARQEEDGHERFASSFLSRAIVKMMLNMGEGATRIVPAPIRRFIEHRFDPAPHLADAHSEQRPSFDLLRAGVNLMVASAVVSYATSQKLPLSTTYVTFMVAMGTSFADRAWGRESAVFRVTGVLSVIGGWFLTALMAFTLSGLAALFIFKAQAWGTVTLLILASFFIWRTHHTHRSRIREQESQAIFNLKKISDPASSISTTFEHMSILLQEIRESLARALEGLFTQNEIQLRPERLKCKTFQSWANIIIANVFKVMRLQQMSDSNVSFKYAQTIRRVQKLVDGHRDIVVRSYDHVRNHHAGLLNEQVEELRKVGELLDDILARVETTLNQAQPIDRSTVVEHDKLLRSLTEQLNEIQARRIRDRESKTRLSILFYAIVGNALMLSKQNLKLLEIFEESFGGRQNDGEFDLD
jgi:phosphate/sulfate permease